MQESDKNIEGYEKMFKFPEASPTSKTSKAKEEERDLERNAKYSKHDRDELMKAAIHKILTIVLWIGFAISAIIIILRVWHLLVPHYWRWFTTEQTEYLDNLIRLIFSGAIGGFATKYFNSVKP